MPRRCQWAPYQHVSEFERDRMIGLRETDLSHRDISARTGHAATTVMRWIEEGRTLRREGTGPLNMTTARDDRHVVRMAVTDRTASFTVLARHCSTATGVDLSASTNVIERAMWHRGINTLQSHSGGLAFLGCRSGVNFFSPSNCFKQRTAKEFWNAATSPKHHGCRHISLKNLDGSSFRQTCCILEQLEMILMLGEFSQSESCASKTVGRNFKSRGRQAKCHYSYHVGATVVRLLASHQGEPGSIPGGVAPGFSHVGIVPDDAAGRRVFSDISLQFPPPLHSDAAPYSPRFALIGSQDLDVKSHPNLFNPSLTLPCNERIDFKHQNRGNPLTRGIVRHDSRVAVACGGQLQGKQTLGVCLYPVALSVQNVARQLTPQDACKGSLAARFVRDGRAQHSPMRDERRTRKGARQKGAFSYIRRRGGLMTGLGGGKGDACSCVGAPLVALRCQLRLLLASLREETMARRLFRAGPAPEASFAASATTILYYINILYYIIAAMFDYIITAILDSVTILEYAIAAILFYVVAAILDYIILFYIISTILNYIPI
ncbi:hypothetical protein PR048_024775, partial [Dryococelus australis]